MTPEPIMRYEQMEPSSSFLETLFDFSFSKYVSVAVIKVLYVLAVIMAAIGTIGGVIAAFFSDFWAGIFALVFAPLLFIVYVLLARILLEVFVVIFRIADYLREIAENTRPQ